MASAANHFGRQSTCPGPPIWMTTWPVALPSIAFTAWPCSTRVGVGDSGAVGLDFDPLQAAAAAQSPAIRIRFIPVVSARAMRREMAGFLASSSRRHLPFCNRLTVSSVLANKPSRTVPPACCALRRHRNACRERLHAQQLRASDHRDVRCLSPYPLLNPRFQRRSIRGLTGREILEITALSKGDEVLERRLAAFPSSS